MAHFHYKSVMLFLRNVLKERKISYQKLSELVQVPESTLKKWFTSEDGTFNRVNTLCSALGLTLNDVLIALDQRTVLTFSMKKKAQDYFMKDRQAFAVYWLLVYERMSVSDILQELNMSDKNLKRNLLKLDQLNLIRLEPNDKVKIPKATPVRWSPEGGFMELIHQEWSHDILKECLQKEECTQLFLQFFQLTKQSKEELKRDIHLLEEKFARRTIQEMSVHGSNLQKIRFLLGTAEGRFSLE